MIPKSKDLWVRALRSGPLPLLYSLLNDLLDKVLHFLGLVLSKSHVHTVYEVLIAGVVLRQQTWTPPDNRSAFPRAVGGGEKLL